jgi:hypothetical protein
MSVFGRTLCAGFTVGRCALFFKNPPGPINHPLQDTKLHTFREWGGAGRSRIIQTLPRPASRWAL